LKKLQVVKKLKNKMSEVVNNPKFMVWFLKRKSRIKFLSMAVRHYFFRRNKDIRRYIAKWFFFEHVDILPRLVELAYRNYYALHSNQAHTKVVEYLKSKHRHSNCSMFDTFCHSYVFQRFFKSELFWGIQIFQVGTSDSSYPTFCLDYDGISLLDEIVPYYTTSSIVKQKLHTELLKLDYEQVDQKLFILERSSGKKKIKLKK